MYQNSLGYIEVRDAQLGDPVVLGSGTRLESVVRDNDFSTGTSLVYDICIGRVASTTVSGLTLLKVYLLTPSGVGYKRFNLGGDPVIKEERVYRKWELGM